MQVIETMTVQEVYQEMSKLGIKTSPQKIRKAIEQRKYPFAISIKMETQEYEIYGKLFNEWVAERVKKDMPLSSIPAPIGEKLDELHSLIDKYPLKIPITECAKFLEMDGDSLRACIENGNCPFGLGWLKNIRGNRAFHIPTATFYWWYTQSGHYNR